MANLGREAEAQRILQTYGQDNGPRVMELLERQFVILANRAQVLLGLCGIVITTTGFSGRLIAGTNQLAQITIITGVSLTLAAAATAVWGVLHLRWISQQPGDQIHDWLMETLFYRDRKMKYYRYAIVLLLLGLAFYVFAISMMLLNPEAATVASGR